MADAFRPNDTPLLLANVNALARFEVVPAERLMEACVEATVALAVIVEPLSPKETLLLFENVMAERLLLVVPPLTLIWADAVMVEALSPKLTLFEFDSVKAVRLFEVVPAEMLTFARPAATDAVTTEPFRPNDTPLLFEKVTEETLFEFESVNAVRLFEVVPAERLMAETALMLAVIVEPFSPNDTPLLFE